MQRGNRRRRKKIEREGETQKKMGKKTTKPFVVTQRRNLANKRNSRSESDKGGQVTSDKTKGTETVRNLKD